MNMAEYGSRRSQQPENVNFEPSIKGITVYSKCHKKFAFLILPLLDYCDYRGYRDFLDYFDYLDSLD